MSKHLLGCLYLSIWLNDLRKRETNLAKRSELKMELQLLSFYLHTEGDKVLTTNGILFQRASLVFFSASTPEAGNFHFTPIIPLHCLFINNLLNLANQPNNITFLMQELFKKVVVTG